VESLYVDHDSFTLPSPSPYHKENARNYEKVKEEPDGKKGHKENWKIMAGKHSLEIITALFVATGRQDFSEVYLFNQSHYWLLLILNFLCKPHCSGFEG